MYKAYCLFQCILTLLTLLDFFVLLSLLLLFYAAHINTDVDTQA